ncbi:hypothetical protein IFR05_017053 [Cadophora sp. M221]|nr:hypothetical protein IFR05_017053 [Cadophora sp. M221]
MGRAFAYGSIESKSLNLLPIDHVQEFLSRLCYEPQHTEHTTGGGDCPSLLNPPHHHAEMTGLYNDAYALRLEQFEEGLGNLLREPFLDLKSPREHIDNPSDLGEANDLAIRDVPDVHLALLAWSRLIGDGRIALPFQRMAQGGARRAKRNQYPSQVSSLRGLRGRWRRSGSV